MEYSINGDEISQEYRKNERVKKKINITGEKREKEKKQRNLKARIS